MKLMYQGFFFSSRMTTFSHLRILVLCFRVNGMPSLKNWIEELTSFLLNQGFLFIEISVNLGYPVQGGFLVYGGNKKDDLYDIPFGIIRYLISQ